MSFSPVEQYECRHYYKLQNKCPLNLKRRLGWWRWGQTKQLPVLVCIIKEGSQGSDIQNCIKDKPSLIMKTSDGLTLN